MNKDLHFLVSDPGDPRPQADARGFTFWSPSPTSLKPPASPAWPYMVWTALHVLHVFKNRDYHVVVSFDEGRLVHRSCVFPKFHRFPFMTEGDLQVGDVWTDPAMRGRGLAGRALAAVLARFPDRRVWYITESDNAASLAVAKKAGMRLRGYGVRTRPAGIGLIGRYRLTRPFPENSEVVSVTPMFFR